jgi:hypothetical protein
MPANDPLYERRRSALATVATVGATIAGTGFGALLAQKLVSVAWALLAAGMVIHLFGMIGTRRLLSSSEYRPGAWEQLGYRACWAVIAVIAAYVIWLLAG